MDSIVQLGGKPNLAWLELLKDWFDWGLHCLLFILAHFMYHPRGSYMDLLKNLRVKVMDL